MVLLPLPSAEVSDSQFLTIQGFDRGRGSHAKVCRVRLLDREIPCWEIADSSRAQIFKWE